MENRAIQKSLRLFSVARFYPDVNDKFKKDDVWENIITSSNKEMLINLCTMLKEHKIKYLLFNTYNRSFNESLTVMIFSKTKADSKLIDAYLDQTDAKYLRMIDGTEVKRVKSNNIKITTRRLVYGDNQKRRK